MKRVSTAGWLLGYIVFGLGACEPAEPPVFERLPASRTGVEFNNAIEENERDNVYEYINIYTGAGVAAGDINNDGLTDLYFSGNQVPGRLYLNKGNLQFEDISASAGILNDQWGTGATMVDINHDGWLDLYVCVSGSGSGAERANLLYVNQGAASDGEQSVTFTEQAAAYGIADSRPTMHASFFDYDRDGDLDLFMIVNAADHVSQVNTIRSRKLTGEPSSADILYRNNATPKEPGAVPFTDVSQEAGIHSEGYSLGLAVSDVNQDGWPDLYLSNDFIGNDVLYINQQDGTFADEASRYFKHTSYAGMGNDVADFNNDGLVDIIELDMRPEDNFRQKLIIPAARYDRFQLMLNAGYDPQYTRNTLQLNRGTTPGEGESGGVTFSEISFLAGVSSTDWSWSSLFADYDNDGDRDLFVTNGFLRDLGDLDYINYQSTYNNAMGTPEAKKTQKLEAIRQLESVPIRDYLFSNNNDLTFTDRSAEWGIEKAGFSNGAVYVDLDNDGDLDLVVNNINEAAHVYENQTSQRHDRHFLRVKLAGPTPNPNGIGTRIRLWYHGQQQYYEHFLNRGYESSVDPVAHFGLDSVVTIDSLEVTWPDGKYQLLRSVAADQLLTIKYQEAGKPTAVALKEPPLFREVSAKRTLIYRHQENEQVDFKVQPLLPHMHSQEGPCLTVGDINGDTLEDLYIGGATGHSGQFTIQQTDGTFVSHSLPFDSLSEDTGALLFDADGDRDLDLYVVSGGTAYPNGDSHYQDRLYLNDGAGRFRKASTALPSLTSSGSIVVASDYDHDGDQDLFVGGRVIPGAYPMPARSYLLRNDSEPGQPVKFTDVTDQIVPALREPGLVTAALWSDYDHDGWDDLLVTGEFMPLRFFRNEQGRLEETDTNLPPTHGWWNSLAGGDFDGDGDTDYLAGNLGLNSRYRATPDEPLCIYASDYDKNGSIDPVMCYYVQGTNYLAHARDEINSQITPMRARFTTYADYARVPFDEAFLPEELNAAYVVRSERFASSYLENGGDGKFTIRDLPMEAQVAPVNAIAVSDYNDDGALDALLVGNNYTADVATGRYDASEGLYLQGDGHGGFKPVGARASGFRVTSDAKSIKPLTLADGGSLLVVGSNSDSLRAFVTKGEHGKSR